MNACFQLILFYTICYGISHNYNTFSKQGYTEVYEYNNLKQVTVESCLKHVL